MISIIVPVFNTQKYVRRCVESIINQTYKDWKLILVDDGSKDESGTICDRLAQTDDRILVVHTENRGASAARNLGLDEASGEYVTFVDADDWLEPYHLQTLIEQSAPDIDLCINSFIADLYYGARPFIYKINQTHDNIESIKAFFKDLLQHSQFLWNKLFRRSIIEDNKIRFDINVSLGEDNIFVLEYLNYIKGLSSSSVCTYHYDQIEENPFSLGRRKRSSIEFIHQLKSNYLAILKLYKTYGVDIIKGHADDYFFTEFFLRIIIEDIDIRHKILSTGDSLPYMSNALSNLTPENINNKIIRCFWSEIKRRDFFKANIIFKYYKIKSDLKNLAISIYAYFKKMNIKYGNIKRKNI